MITNYSFSYWAGEEQQYLYNTLLLSLLYSIYTIGASFIHHKYLYTLSLQQCAILTIPFVVSSWNDVSYFLFHARFHIVSSGLMYSLSFLEEEQKRDILYQYTLIVGYIHLAVLYLVHFQELQNRPAFLVRKDPFSPYAISREVLHADSITKPPADSREGNKGSRRAATAYAGRAAGGGANSRR